MALKARVYIQRSTKHKTMHDLISFPSQKWQCPSKPSSESRKRPFLHTRLLRSSPPSLVVRRGLNPDTRVLQQTTRIRPLQILGQRNRCRRRRRRRSCCPVLHNRPRFTDFTAVGVVRIGPVSSPRRVRQFRQFTLVRTRGQPFGDRRHRHMGRVADELRMCLLGSIFFGWPRLRRWGRCRNSRCHRTCTSTPLLLRNHHRTDCRAAAAGAGQERFSLHLLGRARRIVHVFDVGDDPGKVE